MGSHENNAYTELVVEAVVDVALTTSPDAVDSTGTLKLWKRDAAGHMKPPSRSMSSNHHMPHMDIVRVPPDRACVVRPLSGRALKISVITPNRRGR